MVAPSQALLLKGAVASASERALLRQKHLKLHPAPTPNEHTNTMVKELYTGDILPLKLTLSLPQVQGPLGAPRPGEAAPPLHTQPGRTFC